MKKNRISRLGREQIENAHEIIICKNNSYYESKYDDKDYHVIKKDNPFIALAVRANNFTSIVLSGEFSSWNFSELKNGVRAIKRINSDVIIKIFSDEEIQKYIQIEKIKDIKFIEAVKKFNAGEKEDLINFLREDSLYKLD